MPAVLKITPSKITICVALFFVIVIITFPNTTKESPKNEYTLTNGDDEEDDKNINVDSITEIEQLEELDKGKLEQLKLDSENEKLDTLIGVDELYITDTLWYINTCPNIEYTDPVINEVNLKIDLSGINMESISSLEEFCKPYTYTVLNYDNGTYHMCTWSKSQDSIVSEHIIAGGIWEKVNIEKMTNILKGKPRGIVIDAGANIGEYTIIAAILGHLVFAFEPVIDHVNMMIKSLALNNLGSSVHIFQNGLSNFNGKSFINLRDKNRGGSSVNLKRTQDVDLIMMDEVFEFLNQEYPNEELLFWKGDIEGWEERMMNGARRWYMHYKPKYLLLEMNSNGVREKKCNLEKFLKDLLENYNALLFKTDGINEGPPIIDDKTISSFVNEFYNKSGYVYDMWLTKKDV